MRMKFLRIFPETCASTWCLFSSWTRNIAFGSGSMTVAMTSMASSLGLPESPFSFFLSWFGRFAIYSCFAHHAGPVTSRGRVKIHGPFAVTATVCSKCAEGLPSAVSAVHSSRSEEHTSELQSLAYLVCRLLLEKKKNKINDIKRRTTTDR